MSKLPRTSCGHRHAEDDEAYDIWTKEVGVPVERCIRIGDNKGARYASDNFWMMGDTGPCGPVHRNLLRPRRTHLGRSPGSPEEDGDRYIEIWNNVFMQFNRDEAGVMHPLPKPSVDTGMGLERISAVLQGVHANYEIDLFQTLLKAAARETSGADMDSPSLKVLADHVRLRLPAGRRRDSRQRGPRATCCAASSAAPSATATNRCPPPSSTRWCLIWWPKWAMAYPELAQHQAKVMATLKQEEDRFFETIEHGMAILEGELKALPEGGIFSGETAFKLHDTYGFPSTSPPTSAANARSWWMVPPSTPPWPARRNRPAPPANSRWPPISITMAQPPPSTATRRWSSRPMFWPSTRTAHR